MALGGGARCGSNAPGRGVGRLTCSGPSGPDGGARALSCSSAMGRLSGRPKRLAISAAPPDRAAGRGPIPAPCLLGASYRAARSGAAAVHGVVVRAVGPRVVERRPTQRRHGWCVWCERRPRVDRGRRRRRNLARRSSRNERMGHNIWGPNVRFRSFARGSPTAVAMELSRTEPRRRYYIQRRRINNNRRCTGTRSDYLRLPARRGSCGLVRYDVVYVMSVK